MNLLSSSLPFTFCQEGKQDAVASNCCTRALPISFSDSYSDKPILAANKPHYSPGLHKFVNIFPRRGTQRRGRLLFFPKPVTLNTLQNAKTLLSKDVSTYPSQRNNEYTDFN